MDLGPPDSALSVFSLSTLVSLTASFPLDCKLLCVHDNDHDIDVRGADDNS